MTLAYKLTGKNATAHIARNNFQYPKPSGKRPGKWVHAVGPLRECANGLHACDNALDLLSHVGGSGERVAWLVEVKGDLLRGANKSAHESLRLVRRLHWDDAMLRLFAADCADRALSLIDDDVDARSWNAVFVARKFARGEAWDAAWAAARDVERSWQSARFLQYLEHGVDAAGMECEGWTTIKESAI